MLGANWSPNYRADWRTHLQKKYLETEQDLFERNSSIGEILQMIFVCNAKVCKKSMSKRWLQE